MKKVFFAIAFLLCIINSIAASAMTIEYDGKTVEYTGSIYDLRVNNKALNLPLSPIIFNDRALVPVREVFEALNATVTYKEQTKCVNISYDNNTISLYINNSVAYINGRKTTIPDNAVPKLINKVGESAKTMVPVRFISESLNMKVDFKDPVIYISNKTTATPTPTVKPTVKPTQTPTQKPSQTPTQKPSQTPTATEGITSRLTKVSFSDAGNGYVSINSNITGNVGKVDAFLLKNPCRLVVDLYNCKHDTPSQYTIDTNGISSVRVGYENNRTRMVYDAENISSATVTYNNNKLTIMIGTKGSAATDVKLSVNSTSSPAPTTKPSQTTTPIPSTSPTSPVDITKIPYAEHKDSEKLIVIDAGHGGKDGGAQGVLDGDAVAEKNLTLQIALKTKKILEDKGYKVKLTRETDQYPTLQARADFANNSNAAVFVSIHINSVESNPDASGTEVYYAPLNNDRSYGVKSSDLANSLQSYLIANLKSTDRGVKASNHLVTRSSLMPAALVEVGFISNEEELRKMTSSAYQTKTAEAIAAGIINTVNKVNIPDNREELMEERLKALEEWETAL